MSKVIKELRQKGLLGKKREEAIIPEKDDKKDKSKSPEFQGQVAVPNNTDQDGFCPPEVKEKVLEIQTIVNELYGMIAGGVKDDETGDVKEDCEECSDLKEEVDVDSIVDEFLNTGWSGDNESQMKAIELLKGLATSDDPKANAFMKRLDKVTTRMGQRDKEKNECVLAVKKKA